jgi:PAS domain S-box-containing protein
MVERTRVADQFQALLAGAPDAVVIVDEAGRIQIANGQAERLFGYDAGALIGQPIELLLPEALRARHAAHRRGYVGDPHTRPMGSSSSIGWPISAPAS